MDPNAVADAVDEIGRMLRADGGDLLLVEADPKTLRVRLELRFDDVSCEECILAPDELARTINAAISRRVPGEFELLLHDPRRSRVAQDHTQRLWSALVAVYQPVLRDVVAMLERDAGIDSGTYSVLAYLDQAGGRMRLRDLHDLMVVRYSQPGLSRLVQRMEQDGIVERRADPDDGRSAVVVLTRTGRSHFRRAHEVYTTALDAHLGRDVSEAAATNLARALEELAARRAT